MADGLTVPFALAAGLSGAVSSTRLIVVGGLAEIAAGRLPWTGLDTLRPAATLSTTTGKSCARSARSSKIPEAEKAEVQELFEEYGLTCRKPPRWSRPSAHVPKNGWTL